MNSERRRRRSGLTRALVGAALGVCAAGCTDHRGAAADGSLAAGAARRAMAIRALVGGAPLPEIAAPEIEVRVGAPGYDPASVEAMITRPVEEALESTPGLESLASTSVEGGAQLTLRFAAAVEPDGALLEVRRRLDALDVLPEDAERPLIVLRGGASEVALWYVLRSRELRPRELLELDERVLSRPLQALPGVVGLERCGVREEAVVVSVDLPRLVAMGLSLRAVESALRSGLIGAPAGVEIEDLGALRVAGSAGQEGLALREVAQIERTEEPPACAAYSVGDGVVVVGELRVRSAHSDRAALDEVLTAAVEVVPPSVEIIRLDPKETLEVALRVPVRGLTPGEGQRALAAAIGDALENLGHRPWALELGGHGDGSPLPAGEGRLLLRAEAGATADVLAALRAIPGVYPRQLSPVDGALQTAAVVVRGDDLESLRDVSGSLAGALRAIPGIADAVVIDDVARPELAVRVDAARAAAVGVDSTEVSRAVTAVLSGIEIAAGQPGVRPRVLLRVQAADSDDRVARLADAVLPRSDGGVVRIADVADIEMVASPAAIRRSDGRRSVTIELTFAAGAGAVDAAIKAAIAAQELPIGVTVELPAPPSLRSR